MAAAPSAQRMSAVLRHLAPGGAADGDGAITAAKAAGPAAMLQGLLPLAAIGAYMMWQRRGKTEEVKGPPSEMELRQEAFGFDTERLEALATWAEALVKTKKVPGMVVLIAREVRRPPPRAYTHTRAAHTRRHRRIEAATHRCTRAAR